MNQFSYLLALRYIRGAHEKKSISTMVIISFLGIFIGSFSLLLTLAIMHGFETVTYERLQTIHAQIIIRTMGNSTDIENIRSIVKNEFPEIIAYSPTALQQVIIQNPYTNDISTVVTLKGVDPLSITQVTNLATKIVPLADQQPLFADMLTDNKVIIGTKLAQELALDQGDIITLYIANTLHRKKIILTEYEVVIGGFFATGIDEFDTSLIFASLNLMHKIFPHIAITDIYLKLNRCANEDVVVTQLQQRLPYEVYSWKELYPAVVAALKLEKYVMVFILALISLIASMNIVSLIFMQINQKKSDIAILRVYGMTASAIGMIFFCMGIIISSIACACGILCALASISFLQYYPFITLPDAYLVTHLPVHLEWYHIIIVFGYTMFLSMVGIWIPLRRTAEIDILQILRYNI